MDRIDRIVQKHSFSSDFLILTKNKGIVLCRDPFVDHDGIIWVGGRIENLYFDYNKKHPEILPDRYHLSKILARYEHNRVLHAGT